MSACAHAAGKREAAVSDLDATFAALADRTRRGIVDCLRRQPCRAGELSRALDVPPAGLSRHLRVLRESRLVEEEGLQSDARVRIYRLRREPFEGLRGWVEEVEAFWGSQLAAFKEHAEGGSARPDPAPPVAPPATVSNPSRSSGRRVRGAASPRPSRRSSARPSSGRGAGARRGKGRDR